MKQIKIGYLPFYIKLYDDNGQDRTPLTDHMKKLVALLESKGLTVVLPPEIPRIREEFQRAVDHFIREDVDCVVTQHLAYSPSLESIDALLRLDVPIIVFDTTPDYQLLAVADTKNCIDNDHGIHGVQDMTCMLKKHHKPYYICAGHAFHSDVADRVPALGGSAPGSRFFKRERIGSVGGSFDGMGDFRIDDDTLEKGIGARVFYMDHALGTEYASLVTEEEIDREIALDRQKYDVQVQNEDNYRLTTKSGLAVRKWMEKERLDAVTVNFLTLDKAGLPKMPFPECCKTLERGLGYAGEGDVLTAGLVGALASVYPGTTFVEMFCPDWERDVLLLSHMGESNPRLTEWSPLVTDMRFRYNSCGDTVSMFGCYKAGPVVYVNLAPMDGYFSMIVTKGEMLKEGLKDGAYGRNTQGWFKPCMPLPEFLEKYSYAGGTHHSAMIYDADIDEIVAFGKMMGFEVTVIE